MAQETVKIDGLPELERQFKALEFRQSRTALGKALRAGASVIRRSVRALVPKRTKLLHRSVKVVTVRKDRQVFAGIVIRPPAGQPMPFYWWFLEAGTAARFWHKKRGRKATGSIRARSYLRRGFDRSADEAADKVQARLGQEIDKLARQAR